MYTIYVVIIDKVVNYIIANFMYTRTLIKTLISGFKKCFNSYTVIHKVYNDFLLIKYNNYVKNFRQMLNKLE